MKVRGTGKVQIEWFPHFSPILEEVFNAESAIWFSPDGSHLAFVSFNDTRVDEMHFEIYGEPGSREFQYPMIESIPYPKVKII